MITLTDKGAEKVQEFLATQSAVAETAGLRTPSDRRDLFLFGDPER